jgi:cardiolipin synthase
VSRSSYIAWIPNFITLARLLAVPVAAYLIVAQNYYPAFWLFVAAGLSDGIDGFVAKQFHMESVAGKYLDPLADKALLLAVFLSLGRVGEIALWLVFLVIFRDFLILGGAIMYHTVTRSLQMQPLRLSKVNTVLQFALAGFVLARLGLDTSFGPVEDLLIYAVAASTLASGAFYVAIWGARAATFEREPRLWD